MPSLKSARPSSGDLMALQRKTSAAPKFRANDATLQRFVGYHMKRAFNVVQADLTRTLRPFDLRMLTYTALVLIVDNPGLSPSQLAEAMDVERPNMGVIVDELEQRALIQRARVPTDRRTYALSATLQGKRLCDRAVKAVTAHERRLLEGITAQSQDTMIAALQLIQSRGGNG